MKMRLTIILLAFTACSAQYRISRINDGRYYFGTNPPRLSHQKNSVAYTGSNPPLTRVKNTYNLENLNTIRTIRSTTSSPPATMRKKLRVVIKRRGNHRPDQNQRGRYKLQKTRNEYRLVDHHRHRSDNEQYKDPVLHLKDDQKSSQGKSESFDGKLQYSSENSKQYEETTYGTAAEILGYNKKRNNVERGGKKYKIEEYSESSPQELPEDSSKINAEQYATNQFDGSGNDVEKYKLSLDLEPPWASDDDLTQLGNNYRGTNLGMMKCSAQYADFGSSSGGYSDKDSAIIRKVQMLEGGGGYHFEYKTENKICGEERRTPVNNPNESEASQGYYQYTGPDNVVYRVDYRAGKEGFVPVAAHLPTPPPIPLAILRALEYQKNYKINKNN